MDRRRSRDALRLLLFFGAAHRAHWWHGRLQGHSESLFGPNVTMLATLPAGATECAAAIPSTSSPGLAVARAGRCWRNDWRRLFVVIRCARMR